jgi:hypothetical protein
MELNTRVYVAGVTQKVAGGQLGVADSSRFTSAFLRCAEQQKTSIDTPLVSPLVACCPWYHPIRFAVWPKSTDGRRYKISNLNREVISILESGVSGSMSFLNAIDAHMIWCLT